MAADKNKKAPAPSLRSLRREILSLLNQAVSDVAGTESPDDQRIHAVRRRCKRIRADLRMLRDDAPKRSRRAGNQVRDAAAVLSAFRDHQIIPEAFTRVEALLRKQQGDRQICDDVAAALPDPTRSDGSLPPLSQALQQATDHLQHAVKLIAALDCRQRKLTGQVLEPMYRRARQSTWLAMQSGAADAFHELRKNIKAHRYQCRFFAPAYRLEFKDHIDCNKQLGDLLGAAQDLTILRNWCEGLSGRVQQTSIKRFVSGCDQLAAQQHQEAIDQACRTFFLSPPEFVKRLDSLRV